MMIYFDNAATTAMSQAALNALIYISTNQYGNPSSVYNFGRKAKDILNESRIIIADCIGADAEEIFFTSGGTEGDNWVISRAGMTKHRIVTSAIEHHAILHPAYRAQNDGTELDIVPVDNKCMIKSDYLARCLGSSTNLVSIMMQNNETGTIQKIKELAEIVHSKNPKSVFHTDAVQSVGHIAIDVHDLGIEMLSASAHKFNGPKGIGFLYIKKGTPIDAFVLGGGQEFGMRSGTENVAGIYSMAKALEDNVRNLTINIKHIKHLEDLLLSSLRDEQVDYTVNAEGDSRATGIINIAINGMDGEGLLNMLDMHDICISIGSACNSYSKERSHVLSAMGLPEEIIDSSVRISIGRYNTESDVIALVNCIKKCYKAAVIAEA